MKLIGYFIREIKNVFEFYLIPFLVVILPQKIYFKIFRFICSHTFFYKSTVGKSHENAKRFIDNINPKKQWDSHIKLLHLVDISDPWLARFRPKKAIKQVITTGNWQKSGGFIALNAHWGTGFIALLDLYNASLNPFFVFSDATVDFKDQGFIEKSYRKFRQKYLNKVSGSLAIPVGGVFEKIQHKIKNNDIPVILFDAPRMNKNSRFELNLFNKKYKIASGFVHFICKENTPFQLYSVKMCFKTGKKTLRIGDIQYMDSSDQLMSCLSSFFEALLLETPELWYLWRQSLDILNENTQSHEIDNHGQSGVENS